MVVGRSLMSATVAIRRTYRSCWNTRAVCATTAAVWIARCQVVEWCIALSSYKFYILDRLFRLRELRRQRLGILIPFEWIRGRRRTVQQRHWRRIGVTHGIEIIQRFSPPFANSWLWITGRLLYGMLPRHTAILYRWRVLPTVLHLRTRSRRPRWHQPANFYYIQRSLAKL